MSAVRVVAAAVGGVVLVVAAVALTSGSAERGGTGRPAAPLAESRVDLPRTASAERKRWARSIRPVRIAIGAIGVRARIVRLGLNRDGTLQVPRGYSYTGWWKGGSAPGQRGPAVIVGHVDSHTGPAVFYRLGRLRRGDSIRIRRRDGRLVRYVVQGLARYSKAHFPTRKVYGATARPTLRLITCSGSFDRSSGHYRANTVVYATVASGH